MTDDYQRGYRDAIAQLMSPAQVAAAIGTTRIRLSDYAEEIGAGTMVGPMRVYTPHDVERLKVRKATNRRTSPPRDALKQLMPSAQPENMTDYQWRVLQGATNGKTLQQIATEEGVTKQAIASVLGYVKIKLRKGNGQ